MAIVQLEKMTLYGAAEQQSLVLARLQELGCVHLIDLSASERQQDVVDTSGDAREALNYLRACPNQLRQVKRIDRFHREAIVDQAVELKRAQARLSDERDTIQKAINDLEPWGEFQVPTADELRGVQFWFYVVPLRDLPDVHANAAACKEIKRDGQNAWIVLLDRNAPENVPGVRVSLDSRPLSELTAIREDLNEALEEISYQRVGLTRWRSLLKDELAESEDAEDRERAATQILAGQEVFAVQGWAPRVARQSLQRFADQHCLALTVEPPDEGEEPPTLLSNPAPLAGSEALMTFYKIPEYRSWDPSVFSFVSFAVFFAMIVADAGYGILLLLITAYLWKRMGKSTTGRRGRNILATVSLATTGYGILCGSYFGVAPPVDSAIHRLVLIDAQSQSQMMPLTIGIGVVHLAIAHLVTAWLKRGKAAAFASLGWVSVMLGASLAAAGSMEMAGPGSADLFTQVGSVFLIGGLIAVFLFSSQRPLLTLNPRDHAMRILEGLQGLTGLSGLFGDALSYLRLFALGLSSAKLSQTFNELGASAWDAAGLGVIAGIGIVVLGHTLNLLLSIMSGVVHGLRLNCIEFYKWSLPEDGYSFKAFAKKAKQQ